MSLICSVIKRLCPFMSENGFSLNKRCFYRIEGVVAYCVELEKPSGLVYVVSYVIPLYVPANSRYYTYGTRMDIDLLPKGANETNAECWCDQLKQQLLSYVFPVFSKIQSPSSFLQIVNKGKLFKTYDCQVPRIDVYRLRFFTALYEENIAAVTEIFDKYVDALAAVPYLTDTVKENRLEEVLKIKDIITKDNNISDGLISKIVEETRFNCFGLGKD